MKRFLKIEPCLGLLFLLLVVSCTQVIGEPPATTASTPTTAGYPAPLQATVTPGPYPPPTQTPVSPPTLEPLPTKPPTPTDPPVPTLPPTPMVTPVPTAAPPYIPEVIGKAQQPFWIYYWQDNEIWRVDDQGQNRELLLDTLQSLGRWLTGYPYPGTDCCLDSPRLVVSPDGQKLAIVVLDKINLSQPVGTEPYTYSLYLFDIQSGDLRFLSDGGMPVWSPDSKRIAFVPGAADAGGFIWGNGLWIADLETNQIYPLVAGDPDQPFLRLHDWAWSPDSQRIAYNYREGYVVKAGIWITSLANLTTPYLVPNVPADFIPTSLLWMLDGQHLLGKVEAQVAPGWRLNNLWMISVSTGERQQLTHNLSAYPGQWSLDGKWLAFDALALYEQEEQPYDIWLVSHDGMQLIRVTSAPPQDTGVFWSPDGTRLVFHRENQGVAILSLETGEIVFPGINLPYDIRHNYAVGGEK